MFQFLFPLHWKQDWLRTVFSTVVLRIWCALSSINGLLGIELKLKKMKVCFGYNKTMSLTILIAIWTVS
jgi:hypothetical protein